MADLNERDSSGSSKIVGTSTDGSESEFIGSTDRRLWVQTLPKEQPTFHALLLDNAIGNNKSMISLVNAGGSTVTIKLRHIQIVNSQTTSVTGIIADFRLYRITGHSVGSLITPEKSDTSDTQNASVTVRTGATVAGESANPMRRVEWGTDEWGIGALDQEGFDHGIQQLASFYSKSDPNAKPITLRPGEGITLKQVINSTVGTFDILLVFTQES